MFAGSNSGVSLIPRTEGALGKPGILALLLGALARSYRLPMFHPGSCNQTVANASEKRDEEAQPIHVAPDPCR